MMITYRLLAFEVLTTTFLVLLLIVQNERTSVEAFGYSYSRFIGPVRGPERQIIVHDRYDGRGRVDYVARPEYQFAYGVEDAKTRVLQNRRETRNGDAVKGVYSVVDPDGSLRVVKYTADNVNGFQAEVTSNGVSTNHGQENPVVVHPDPQQLVGDDDDDDDAASVVAGDSYQVNAKDDTKPLQPNHHIQVQHPHSTDREEAGVQKIPQVIEVNNEYSSSDSGSRDTSDYDSNEDDGGKSSESRDESEEEDEDGDRSEEIEDY